MTYPDSPYPAMRPRGRSVCVCGGVPVNGICINCNEKKEYSVTEYRSSPRDSRHTTIRQYSTGYTLLDHIGGFILLCMYLSMLFTLSYITFVRYEQQYKQDL
jgi:hypothetical protein